MSYSTPSPFSDEPQGHPAIDGRIEKGEYAGPRKESCLKLDLNFYV
jgi:hypothetical protein